MKTLVILVFLNLTGECKKLLESDLREKKNFILLFIVIRSKVHYPLVGPLTYV